MSNKYLFTSESVSEGHPDKVCDIISDSVVDDFLSQENPENSRVAMETLVTTNKVVMAGEVRGPENYKCDYETLARNAVKEIGYEQEGFHWEKLSFDCSGVHSQSADIAMGVDASGNKDQGAGDQGIMFGYASNETENYMPLALAVSHKIMEVLAEYRRAKSDIAYLRPDAKSQVTVEYGEDNKPIRIEKVVVSTQHDNFDTDQNMAAQIRQDIINKVMPEVIASFSPEIQSLFSNNVIYHINPTGKFVIGGPHGDTGLTGRKIIVDTYGGKGAHGGGAFSGKDPSKVDRSAAYAARHIAKNAVAAGIADEVLIQLSYAIGVASPTSIFVDTYGTSHVDLSDSKIAKKLETLFDLTPYGIEQRLKLRTPIYAETAAYGHMGRTPKTIKKVFESPYNGKIVHEVELFPWEKLDAVSLLQSSFTIK